MARNINLQQLVDGKKLSPDGRNWLLCALDPFHDWKFCPEGYPDVAGANSVVIKYVSTTTITAPGAGNWDCLVSNMGFDLEAGLNHRISTHALGANTLSYDHAAFTNQYTLSPISIFTDGAGTSMFPNNATTTVTGLHTKNHSEPGRLVGLGYEVHNTTAEMYKQGTVTCGSMPQVSSMGTRIYRDTNGAPYVATSVPTRSIVGPPQSAAQAAIMPNSATWEASRGCYVIPKLSGIDNACSHKDRRYLHYEETTSYSDQVIVNNNFGAPDYNCENVFDISYAYFTGLSNETALTVTVVAYYEYFPDCTSDLCSQATPSPSYDVCALKLYSKLCKNLPCAVPVGMNPKGEYFKKITGLIGQFASSMALPLMKFNPTLGGVVGGVGMASTAVSNMIPAKKKKNKRKPGRVFGQPNR